MERSSPSRVSGRVTRDVTVQGETYTLSQPEKVGTHALQEELILSRRLDGIEFAIRACNRLPANRHAAVWEGCAMANSRGIASQEEWSAYETSLWKPAFMFWQSLDSKHKGSRSSVDGVRWAVELINAMTQDEFQVVMSNIAIVSQEKALGELSGLSESQATPQTDSQATPASRSSMTSSPNADSPETK